MACEVLPPVRRTYANIIRLLEFLFFPFPLIRIIRDYFGAVRRTQLYTWFSRFDEKRGFISSDPFVTLAKPSDVMVAKDDAALKDIFKAGNDESLDIFVMVMPLSCMK